MKDLFRLLVLVLVLMGGSFLGGVYYSKLNKVEPVQQPIIPVLTHFKAPTELPKPDTVYLHTKGKKTVKTVVNPLDSIMYFKYKKLLKDYDSVSLLTTYVEAITEREYLDEVDDTNIYIEIYSKTIGTLSEQSVVYRIKPKQQHKLKEIIHPSTSHVFLGGFVGVDLRTSDPILGVSGTMQTKKGVFHSISYDTQKVFRYGVKFKIW